MTQQRFNEETLNSSMLKWKYHSLTSLNTESRTGQRWVKSEHCLGQRWFKDDLCESSLFWSCFLTIDLVMTYRVVYYNTLLFKGCYSGTGAAPQLLKVLNPVFLSILASILVVCVHARFALSKTAFLRCHTNIIALKHHMFRVKKPCLGKLLFPKLTGYWDCLFEVL